MKSDNGPHYAGLPYQQFAQNYGFRHITSSPHYPQSNGFIERMVQTVKNTIKKCKDSKTDPYLALLCLRATPVEAQIPAPSAMLYGRQIQDNMPRKQAFHDDDIYDRLMQRQVEQKFYHDRHARSLPVLSAGQPVRIQDPVTNKWVPSTIRSKDSNSPRSYKVITPAGNEVRRNRSMIKPNYEHPQTATSPTKSMPTTEPDAKDIPRTSSSVTPGTVVTRSGRISRPVNRLDL